jgi:hypothetical protein
MAVISGLAVAELSARGLGFLDTTAILMPLAEILRPLEEEEAAMIAERASISVESAALFEDRVESVTDKMAALAAEVDSCSSTGADQATASSVEVNPSDNVKSIEADKATEDLKENEGLVAPVAEEISHQSPADLEETTIS